MSGGVLRLESDELLFPVVKVELRDGGFLVTAERLAGAELAGRSSIAAQPASLHDNEGRVIARGGHFPLTTFDGPCAPDTLVRLTILHTVTGRTDSRSLSAEEWAALKESG